MTRLPIWALVPIFMVLVACSGKEPIPAATPTSVAASRRRSTIASSNRGLPSRKITVDNPQGHFPAHHILHRLEGHSTVTSTAAARVVQAPTAAHTAAVSSRRPVPRAHQDIDGIASTLSPANNEIDGRQ